MGLDLERDVEVAVYRVDDDAGPDSRTGVRMRHIPTGTVVEECGSTSMIANRARAVERLRELLGDPVRPVGDTVDPVHGATGSESWTAWVLTPFTPEIRERLLRTAPQLRDRVPDCPTLAQWRQTLGGEAGPFAAPDGSIVHLDLSPFDHLSDSTIVCLNRRVYTRDETGLSYSRQSGEAGWTAVEGE